MSIEAIAPFLAGPASAVFLAILTGGALYQFSVKKVFPLIEAAVSRHLAQVDEMNTRHSEEHQRILDRLDGLQCRANNHEAAK